MARTQPSRPPSSESLNRCAKPSGQRDHPCGDAQRAAALAEAAATERGCRTAKVKVAEPGVAGIRRRPGRGGSGNLPWSHQGGRERRLATGRGVCRPGRTGTGGGRVGIRRATVPGSCWPCRGPPSNRRPDSGGRVDPAVERPGCRGKGRSGRCDRGRRPRLEGSSCPRRRRGGGIPTVASCALDTSVGLAQTLAFAAALPELDHDCGLGTGALLAADLVSEPLFPDDGVMRTDYRARCDNELLAQATARVSEPERDRWLQRLSQAWTAGTRARLGRLWQTPTCEPCGGCGPSDRRRAASLWRDGRGAVTGVAFRLPSRWRSPRRSVRAGSACMCGSMNDRRGSPGSASPESPELRPPSSAPRVPRWRTCCRQVIEADASDVPMVLVTADRPPELRGVGANQTIVQPGIFGGYLRAAADLETPAARAGVGRYWRSTVSQLVSAAGSAVDPGPVHLNVGLRAPCSIAMTRRPSIGS